MDEDPEYFRIVLNFLRKGKLINFDEENLFDGVLDLAKIFELAELVKVLENDWKERVVVLEEGEKMSSESSGSMVSLNMGGTIFQTSPPTMLKYPGSKLEKMFKEDQRIKNPTFFLDEDPKYFRTIMNFLNKGKLFTFDKENLFDGVLDLAKKFELAEVVKVLENDWKERVVVLEIGEKEIKISRKFLTRVSESYMAKFFNEEKESQNSFSDCISKKGPNCYFIRCKARKLKIGFLKRLLTYV